MDSSIVFILFFVIETINKHPSTVTCVSASGELLLASGSHNLAQKTSASSFSSPLSSSSSLPTAEALTSAVTSVSFSSSSSRPVDVMTDTLSFNQPGAFVQLHQFAHLDPPPAKVGWSFEFYTKTDSPSAILLYATSVNIFTDDPIDHSKQTSSSTRGVNGKQTNDQFISIEVINGKPALSIDDGEGIVNVHSDIFISDGLWHHINAVFAPSHLELTVDRNARTVKQATSVLSDRISPSSLASLNYLDLTLIYLGGVDAAIEPVILQQQVQTIYSIGLDDSSLVGCIREVKINRKVLEEKQIKLTNGISKGPKCNWEFICAVDSPCIEDSACYQSGFDDFNCVCESSICIRPNFTRSSLHKQFQVDHFTATSGHKVHHHQQQQQMNHLARSKGPHSPHASSSSSLPSVDQSFPGANGNLGPSSSPREDEKSTQDVSVGGKKIASNSQSKVGPGGGGGGGLKLVSDLPAAGQSHIISHRTNPATSGPAWGGEGVGSGDGGGHQSPNLGPGGRNGGLSSSLAHSTPSLDPSASLASVNSPSSSSSSFPELSSHFTVPLSPPSSSSPSNERTTVNGNAILQGGQMSQGQNVIDSLHNINQINSVGGFASNAFNFVISKEQLLIVTVIIAVTIVLVLFSTVIRAFYLLGKKSESRNKSKSSSNRSGNSSSSSSSSCSSPAQLMKDTDNSCILPLTSTTTGSTSVAGSSSGGTSSSPLPFGSDCGYDHHSHLEPPNGLPNYNLDHTRNQLALSLPGGGGGGSGTGSTSGYGHVSHNLHHQIHPSYRGTSEHGSDLMTNHNLVMMMSRCSSTSSLPSTPLPPPPDPLTTRSQFMSYAPATSSYYQNSQSNTCDQIQLHPYPHPHPHIHPPHPHHQHHQGPGGGGLFQHRNSEGDTSASGLVPPSHPSNLEMCDSSESSHLLMQATGVTGCSNNSTSNNTNFGGAKTSVMPSYKSESNSDHFLTGSTSGMNDATGGAVCLNYTSDKSNSQNDKRHLARYSTYGTVSSGPKKSPNSLANQVNYTTDDLMDAYATYSRVDKNRDKSTNNQISPQSKAGLNHLNHSNNSYNRQQHRLSISSPSSSSTSSASPYNNSNTNTSSTNGAASDTITITTNRRDSGFIYPLPPPSLFFSRQQHPNGQNNPASPLLQDHNNLTSTFKWS